MPELPEVATYQKFAEEAALHRVITRVGVVEPRVVVGNPDHLKAAIEGNQIIGTDRLGKQLFLKLDNGRLITVHFGMTGSWRLYRQQEEQPRFIKVFFQLDDGMVLGFRCPRILGRIGTTDSVEEFRKNKKLGQDGLQIFEKEFTELFNTKKGLIKPLLMNQRYVAGLGNWIVDEMLYQAKIHPERSGNTISTKEYKLLYQKMQEILKLAINEEAEYTRFPDSYLVTFRWYDREGHPLRKQNIQTKKVGGRTTYYDADRQKI
jgi:formamidopyrimidine-DNA glycosylase